MARGVSRGHAAACPVRSPISAATGIPRLSGAVVTPRTGTPASTVVITVIYRNDRGWAAEGVIARVGTADKAMSRLPGGDWRKGVAFRWSGKLPVGTHAVVIRARSSHRGDASLGAGTVKISPAATPKPTPKPTPRSTPKPTPRPTTSPAATPNPTAAPTAGSPAGPDLSPSPTPMPFPTATPTALPTATPSALPITAAVAGTDGSTPPGSNGTTGPIEGAGQRSGGWGPLASLMAMAGFQGPSLIGLTIGPTLVTTTGAVALGMAFGLFGRKRREDESDDALSAAAASGVGFMPHDGAVAVADGIAAASGAVLGADDTEALMPRWRRPSLIQARKADPIRDNEPAPRLTFDHGLVGPLDGRERKVIRYRVVRLLDSPDELRGAEIGYLDQGDEVQLLEKYGAYWLVLSPDGQQGWLHKMTLGDVYEEDAPPTEGPVATMPIAAESWTMGEADIDGDVFEAYLESRRRRGA